MRKLLLATAAAVTVMAAPAVAADLAPVYKAAPVVRPACAQFGGFYVGASGGWAYHDRTWTDRDSWVDNFSNDWSIGGVTNSRSGGTAGVQAGYNWQRGCTLFGIEVDASWAGLKGSNFLSPSPGGTTLTLEDNLNWWATARTRTGVIVDNLLLYVTGGAAYANIKQSWTITDPNDPSESFSAQSGRWGWVGGVGVEWAWSDQVSIKSEALYIRFSDISTTVFSPQGGQNVTFDHHDAMWVSRIGLNVKLGGPVVAKY